MAVVTSDFLAGVLTNFRAFFQSQFDAATNISPWQELATPVKSEKGIESYNWLGTAPQMIDVTHGDLQLEGLFPFNFQIVNNTYKAAIEVARASFEDDSLGLITPRVAQLGMEAARHPGQLLFQLPALNGLAYDGVAFFADTRVIGRSANIDNNLAKHMAGAAQTVAEIQQDLGLARASMRKFQDDQGRPMNNVPNYIMVPPEMEQPMYQALNITFPAASPNVGPVISPATNDGTLRSNGYTVIVNPYASDATTWWLFSVQGALRPFIWQTRVAPSLEGTITPNTDSGVIRDRFVYTVRARYNVGYGDPRYAVRVA